MIKNFIQAGINRVASLSFKKQIAIVLLVVIAVGFLGYRISQNHLAVTPDSTSNPKLVTVASVAALGNSGSPLTLSGEVQSLSEANIKTEATGRITHVYKKIGDAVIAGEIIAQIENSGQLAALNQAEAALVQAEAGQNISDVGQSSAVALLKEARNSTVNTLRSTYDAINDIVYNKLDPMYSNPNTANPSFNIASSNSQYVMNANYGRLKIQAVLNTELARKNNLSINNDLISEINLTENELAEIKNLIDTINSILNTGLATAGTAQATIDADKLVASTVRTSWGVLMADLSAAKDNLTAKTAAVEVAQQQGSSQSTTYTTSDAAIAQAQSGVQLAQVALEKTIIRSPISGTLNSLPITQGDFVSLLQPAATVSNNNSLEILAYITDTDSREISVGNNVDIGGLATGVVTRIAPALDPLTKKIEVHIGILRGLDALRNGQSVNLSISRTVELIKNTSQKNLNSAITVPIESLKITPDGAVVFTVEGGALRSHLVKMGALLGDRIAIIDGLTPSMNIVTDARGLKDGELVQIKQ